MLVVAGMAMFLIIALILSLFIYLPTLAIAETISPRWPGARAAIWFLAIVLPPLCSFAATLYGLHSSLTDRLGSPHLTSDRLHLCSTWVFNVPDIVWFASVSTKLSLVVIFLFTCRGLIRSARSILLSQRLWKTGCQNQPGLCIVQQPTPYVVTVGIFKPIIIMTTGVLEKLGQAGFSAVLSHEQAHQKRRDGLWKTLIDLFTGLQFASPTVYLYGRYWQHEVERACDDAAALSTSPDSVADAMVTLHIIEMEAVDRSLPGMTDFKPQNAIDVSHRAARLRQTTPALHPEATDVGPIGILLIGGGVLVVVLGLAATISQVSDTLRCQADTLLTLFQVK